jgi:beta-barrel assembly-enhancing protease
MSAARLLPAGFILAAILLFAGCDGGGLNIQNVDVGSIVRSVADLRPVQEPEEIEIGQGMVETLLGARPLLDDPELQRYVSAVGLWVARQSERPDLPWQFGVNDSDHINAFAAPGGYVIVTKGMMASLRNEAELAGVLGHEIAHVVQKHHLRALRKNAVVNLLSEGASAATSDSRHRQMVEMLVGPTKELYARGLDKSDEFEADRMGVVLAARAGYDPYGLPAVLTTLAAVNPADSYLALLYKTHPPPDARIQQLMTGMGTRFDAIADARQNATRFQQATRRLQVATR